MTHEEHPLTPSELFDQAVNQPARRADLFSDLAAAFIAAAEEGRARRKAIRDARRNQPAAIAARKAAARRGWETRRRNAAEKAAEEAAEAERELDTWGNRPGPRCNQMSHDSRGTEAFCHLDPGHDEDEHDNGLGTRWPRDENEDEFEPALSGEEVPHA